MGFEGCIQGRKNVKRKNLASVPFYLQKRGEIFLRKFFPCSNSPNFAYLRPVFVQGVLALTLGSKSDKNCVFPLRIENSTMLNPLQVWPRIFGFRFERVSS